MKIIKRLFLACLLIVLFLVGAVVLAINLVDLNDYKDRIENVARKQTGRELSIDGDLGVSYFPWLGITLGELQLANAEGFGDQPFAKIDGADVKVEVMPLLRRTVNVKTVQLHGLELDLQRAADGTTNWDDLAKRSSTVETETEDNTTAEVEGDPASIAALAVGGVEVTEANVNWTDAQAGTNAKLSDFNLKTGRIELSNPFNVETNFSLSSSGIQSAIAGSGDITLDLENQRYVIDNLNLSTDSKGDALPGGALAASLATGIVADLNQQSVVLDSLVLDSLGIKLNGNISVSNLDTEPLVTAKLDSAPFDPSAVMTKLGIALPETADVNVLKSASVTMDMIASPKAVDLQTLKLKLDDTTFNGELQVPDLAGNLPPVRFKLDVDAIDLDRYLPAPPTGTETAAASTEQPSTAASRQASGDEVIELPMELLRQLDIDGSFSVGSLKVANLNTNDILVPLTAKGGVVQLDGIKAALYQGNINSTMGVDARNPEPAFNFQYTLSGVQAEPLLKDLLQDEAPVTGQADFSSNFTTAGNTVNKMKAALNGTFSSDFSNGAVNGINVGYQLRRAQAVLKGQTLEAPTESVRTDFSAMHVGATVVNGVLNSDDLDVRSPALRITGEGSVDLVQEYVDYRLNTKVAPTVEGQGGKDLEDLAGLALSIPIRGKFGELSGDFSGTMLDAIKDDLKNQARDKAEALARQEADKIKAEAMAKAEKAKAKAEAQLREKEAEARAKLAEERARAEEKLQSELAEQNERVNKEVDQLKNKAQDKLKNLFK